MIINPWDYLALVFVPFMTAFVLFLRRFHLRDTSGDRKHQDPFAPIALTLAGASVLPPVLLVVLRTMHVFIPWGSVWFGLPGCALAAWAATMQRRRTPPSPVPAKGPKAKDEHTARPRQAGEGRPSRRAPP